LSSNFLYSYNRVKLTKLYVSAANTVSQVILGTPQYNVGYDLTRVFSFRWAGLDPNTGDPMGYVNGQPVTVSNTSAGTTAYNAINSQPSSEARYHGSAIPTHFGSLRNTFSYAGLSVSANLLYKLGYYFRRPASELVLYNSLFNNNQLQGAEYSNRWKNPGDELHTNVPSQTYPASTNRDRFYQYSEINVLKGDHIRLQEINLSYGLSKKSWFIKNPKLYMNLPLNIMLWRANKAGLDPDVFDYPMPKTYSVGFSANL